MIVRTESHVECERGSIEWLPVLGSIRERVICYVTQFSEKYDLCPFDLKLRVLLHLPRFQAVELETDNVIFEEIGRLARATLATQRDFKGWVNHEPIATLKRSDAHVSEVSDEVAAEYHRRFHYIGACRDGRHFALQFERSQVPAALVTISEMDVEKIRIHLPLLEVQRNLLLSRMFAFRWAPRNTISYLLGQVTRWLKREGQTDSLVTWVNPNLGFQASSYRAANWFYLGSEPVIYRYLDGNYLTARQLFDKAKNSTPNIETSKFRLAPLQIWRYRIAN
jgi:hypothetical protein